MKFREDINCKKKLPTHFLTNNKIIIQRTVVTYQILKIMNEEGF